MTSRNARVLLVEDNPTVARLLEDILSEACLVRFDVEIAGRLSAARERLAAGRFDAVLLDLSLPDSHGFETFVAVREAAGDVPVLVLTGVDDQELALRAVRAGAQDFLVKGMVHHELLARSVRHAIERHKAQRELAFQAHILEHVNDAVLATDVLGRIVYWNAGAEEVFGYSAEEMLGATPARLYREGEEERFPADFELALSGYGDFQTWRGRRRDGSDVWVDLRVKPLLDGRAAPAGVVAVGKDVTDRKRAEDALRESAARLDALVAASPLAIVSVDREGRVTQWSPAAEETFGWTAAEVLGQPLPNVPADKLDEDRRLREGVLAGEGYTGLEIRRSDRAGSAIDLRASAAPLRDADGRITGVVSFHENVSDRKRAERAIRRLASLPEQSPDPLVELDLEGNALYVNAAARSRFPDLQALGTWHPVLGNVGALLQRFRHGERKSFSSDVAHEDTVYHQMVHHVPDSRLVRVFLHDVTEQLRARQQLARAAQHDRLTGLPNRSLFLERVEAEARAGREWRGAGFVVLALNLDRFKVINDSLGQAAGDQLLVEVGQRIASVLGSGDTAARLASDEYAVIARSASLTDCLLLADRLRDAVSQPVELSRQEIFPSVSIGIAPGEGYDDPEALLRDAQIAAYRAKSLGGGRCEVFDRAMGRRSLERLRLENELRRALERGKLKLFYQPIVRLADGALVGFEALARWPHPERGLVPPAEFIPIAEETGLIVPLTAWTIAESCQRLAELQALCRPGEPELAMHVNLSSPCLADPGLLDRLRSALAASGVAGSHLVLEITESVFADPASAAEVLARIKDLGAQLALDDFGTGYSSLGYLQQFPIDVLKIDRSFVAKLGGGGENPEVLRAILTLAQRLGIEVIAEGVETERQLGQLFGMGCRLAQGFLFATPAERDAARELIRGERPWAGLIPQIQGLANVTPMPQPPLRVAATRRESSELGS